MRIAVFLTGIIVNSQILQPAKWQHYVLDDDSSSEKKVLVFEVQLDKGWYIYSTDFLQEENIGPGPTLFSFEPHPSYELLGEMVSENSKKKKDDFLGLTFRYMDESPAIFKQRIKILSKDPVIKGTYEYQVCTLKDGMCIPGDGEFEIKLENKK